MHRTLLKSAGLVVTGLGLALIAFYFLQTFDGYAADAPEPTGGGTVTSEETARGPAPGPGDETLRLSVPKAGVENAEIPTAEPNEASLRDNVAVRLPGSGLPWQEESNVYIAGHELGYPFTDSFRAFYRVKDLEEGDKVYLTDAGGTEYTYEVFEVVIVQPGELWVLDPLEGRNIVSLQVSETQQKQGDVTPKRVVRAELVEKT